jgi:hypothetical protein
MLNNKALRYTINLNYLQRQVRPAEVIFMTFRLLSNQQPTTVFGIIRKGNKRIKIIVLVEGRLSFWGSHSERGMWSGFGNRVLRKIFGPKRDEVIGDWRKLPNEELYDFSPHQILFV